MSVPLPMVRDPNMVVDLYTADGELFVPVTYKQIKGLWKKDKLMLLETGDLQFRDFAAKYPNMRLARQRRY